ncbi:3-hydroxyacyl-ACP dehydratase [Fluviicola taffensis]|uniref:Beta-hydroxyacyl-(Acyl-carrier-protein) dehydratase FabA/FabZ n=1 Tax=Fluviicola taffensis (strain DSM 16823 / NCIMB 13979 / RW262) TaxID=755732 RepID=F2IEB4_FLUTR|nr:3-hydroxyacyl-ACP dehydratase [Fluviicola taffensis]AEA43438.1 Beta-hydroxyacyl-(acyl-carrier-protein) dehydratase FabA/FabZ [Fluviicola taffensis DSM 16823]
MILKDTFYTINSLKLEEQALEANITIDANHSIFEGHFPGNPVTPGVVQLELIKELLSTQFGEKIQLKTLSNSKFLAVLNPVNTPEVHVKMTVVTQEDDSLKVSGQMITGEVVCLKFSGIYTKG